MSIKLQILLNFCENVSWKSTGNHTCWSVRRPDAACHQSVLLVDKRPVLRTACGYMLSAILATAVLSVRPSWSVRCRYCVKMMMLHSLSGSPLTLVFRPRHSRSSAAYSRQTLMICASFSRSVCPVHCGKTAHRIQMPFGIIGLTGSGMRQLVGFWNQSMGRGTFWGQIWGVPLSKGAYRACICYSSTTRNYFG